MLKFIPYLSNNGKPLQNLLKAENESAWLPVYDEAFNDLKVAIVKDITLKYFDPRLPIYIEMDASKKGIGVVLMQPDNAVQNTSKSTILNNLRPAFCTSKADLNAEVNYRNTECEMLGVVFSILHFKHFTYGCNITVITDHKPLITLFKKNIAQSSPHLSRMLMKKLDFHVDLQHQ